MLFMIYFDLAKHWYVIICGIVCIALFIIHPTIIESAPSVVSMVFFCYCITVTLNEIRQQEQVKEYINNEKAISLLNDVISQLRGKDAGK